MATDRPPEVGRALGLLWSALALSCLSFVLTLIDYDDDDVPMRYVVLPGIAMLSFNAALIWLVGQGRTGPASCC